MTMSFKTLLAAALLLSGLSVKSSAESFNPDSVMRRGYRGTVEAAYHLNIISNGRDYTGQSFMTTHGYLFCPYAFLGFSTGYNRADEEPSAVLVPMLLNLRLYAPIKRLGRFTPYADLRYGPVYLLYDGGIGGDWMTHAAFGVRYALGRKTALSLSCGYESYFEGLDMRLGFEF